MNLFFSGGVFCFIYYYLLYYYCSSYYYSIIYYYSSKLKIKYIIITKIIIDISIK